MTSLVITTPSRLDRVAVEHAARTAVGATISLLVARLFSLPESYWAAVTTMIVLQSTLGAALSVSALRFIGTVMGAAAGAVQATVFGPNVLAYCATIVLLGILNAALHLDRSAFRFAGITLTIVMLVVHGNSPWIVAVHRAIEVSIGIVIGLLLTAVWPTAAAG
jgi:uncharacterized membrane protein YccC